MEREVDFRRSGHWDVGDCLLQQLALPFLSLHPLSSWSLSLSLSSCCLGLMLWREPVSPSLQMPQADPSIPAL